MGPQGRTRDLVRDLVMSIQEMRGALAEERESVERQVEELENKVGQLAPRLEKHKASLGKGGGVLKQIHEGLAGLEKEHEDIAEHIQKTALSNAMNSTKKLALQHSLVSEQINSINTALDH